jgi:hypothetical protein
MYSFRITNYSTLTNDPLIHDKPTQKTFQSDRVVNGHTTQDDEKSVMKQRLQHKYRASSTSRCSDALDTRSTATASDVPSVNVSRPLPPLPLQGTSNVDVIENRTRPTRFTDHNSPLLNRTLSMSAMRRGMFCILMWCTITKSNLKLIPPLARALHPKLVPAFRPAISQL